ncbi:MAG: MinD/ParA family protein [Firmicutes bacterium]|nr:MinD/ParA family protein [Bacillota bacterium]
MNDQAARLREMVLHLKGLQKTPNTAGPRIITVTSGKGGVGKSCFTANLALCLQDCGYRVLILDADFGLANIDVMLGVTSKYNFAHLIDQSKSLIDIIAEGPKGVKLISGGSGLYELVHLGSEQLELALRDLPQLENMVDILLIDTGAGVTDAIIKLIVSSHEVIFVTTPEPTSIIDAYALLKNVNFLHKDSDLKFWLLVNRADSEKEAEKILHHFIEIAERFQQTHVEKLGYILFDELVTKSIKLQSPYILEYPKCTAAKEIRRIAMRLLEGSPQIPLENNLAKLFKRFTGIWKTKEEILGHE